jgi:zinc-finger of transposase IS204/IS1001/IS1096/IS1165
VHSRYERRVSDTVIVGQETMIHLRVRRFICPNQDCASKTFAEQVPGLSVRYGRRSTGLTEALQAVALALGGRVGARLAGRLAVAAGHRPGGGTGWALCPSQVVRVLVQLSSLSPAAVSAGCCHSMIAAA